MTSLAERWPGLSPEGRQMLTFALSIFGFPIASALPTLLGVSSRFATVPFRAVVLVTALSLFPVLYHRLRAREMRGGQILIALVMGMEALRLVWDFAITKLPLDLNWNDYFLLYFGASVVPTLAMQQPTSPEGLQRMARLCELMGAIGIVLVLAAVAVELVKGLSGSFRLRTEVLNPISLGHLAVSLVIVSAYCMLIDRKLRSRFRAIGMVLLRSLLILVSLAVLFATGSKGPLLALLIVSACAMVMLTIKSPKLLVIAALAASIVTIGAAAALSLGLPGVDRLLVFGSDQSGLERLQLTRGALSQFEENPVFGSAVVEYFRRMYPHNVVVDAMMSLGIFGAALFVSTLIAAFARALWLLRQSMLINSWFVLLFVQYMVDSMFSGALALSPQMWICLGMVWVLPGKQLSSLQTHR